MTNSRKEEIFLAKTNGKASDLYVQDVRERVRGKHIPVDEIAILRKMVNRLLELVIELHGSEISDSVIEEFMTYNTEVEEIKAELREEIGI